MQQLRVDQSSQKIRQFFKLCPFLCPLPMVMDYLQSDRAVFVNAAFRTQLDSSQGPEKPVRGWSCDAVAIDLRHGAVYICQAAIEQKPLSLIKKLSAWNKKWELIKTAVQRDCKVPAKWRIHVWLFVPRESIEIFDSELEELRHVIGSKFKVKITVLEDVQPWRASTWQRCEAAWEPTDSRS